MDFLAAVLGEGYFNWKIQLPLLILLIVVLGFYWWYRKRQV